MAGAPEPRAEVAQSWMRSLRTVDPAQDSAPTANDADVRAQWSTSPLRGPVLQLADELRTIADDAGYVAAVTDESGTILWSCGGRVMRRRAERVNFAPGARWDEPHMGTTALSLALRSGRPSTVFSAEHLVAALHGWVCYCAPIHDPRGRRLGVLDLSTVWNRAHPLAMSTVRTLATTIETRLAGSMPTAAAGIELNCLGTAEVSRDGQPARIRPRQLEILTLLALDPKGFTPDRLRDALYGDRPVSAATLKAEVSHLRSGIGGGITNRRYTLSSPIACDATDLQTALDAGDTATAVRLYRGPLLPESCAPGIVQWRHHLEVSVRTAVLASDCADDALRYGEHALHDATVHQHALRLLAPDDARRGVAAARLHSALLD
ncbi:GAF domain-containing protein [Streptomyces antimycoticus]|uniref:GAF domain-containing protein n=1 Tax=Streptomyces antimycoticus TaxID=68175 RepID=UPI00367EC25E